MNLLGDVKLITCVLPGGRGVELVEALHEELAVATATLAKGRGISARGGPFSEEMDILSVLIEAERANEVFEYIYFRAEVHDQIHRFMFQVPLARGTAFTLPELPAQSDAC